MAAGCRKADGIFQGCYFQQEEKLIKLSSGDTGIQEKSFYWESGAGQVKVEVCMSAEISVFNISVILARAKGIIYPVEVIASRLVWGFLLAKLVG